MNTKILMVSSAGLMAGLGITASFFSQEIMNYTGTGSVSAVYLVVQVIGALYLGFAFMNWMARANIIGGIYSKPLAMGNFMHFFVATMALIKALPANMDLPVVWILTIVYGVFAFLFGWVAFTKPARLK